jgi:SPP1 family predicted phage head-tail adaptor
MTLPISYKVPTTTATGSGGTTFTYEAGPSDYADIKATYEKNENIADQTQQGSELVFKIQYRPSLAITDKWLIVFEGTDYKINSIERKDLDKKFYLIKAKALK